MQLQLLCPYYVPGRQPGGGEEEAKEKVNNNSNNNNNYYISNNNWHTFSIADHTFSNVCSINIYKTELRSKNIYDDTFVNRAQEFQSKSVQHET